jgi:hypothetical protein
VAYEDSWVLYADILGFRKLVETFRDDPEQPLQVLQALQKLDTGPALREKYRVRFHQVSDAVLAVMPRRSSDELDIPCAWARQWQLSLLADGLLLRGGLTGGKVYMDDAGLAFGPAINRAYELEAHSAVYPRVVVDPDCVTPEMTEHGHVIRFRDSVWFINYLYPAGGLSIVEGFDNLGPVAKSLSQHRSASIGIFERAESPDQMSKCCWLVVYHNLVIDQISRRLVRMGDTGRAWREKIEGYRISDGDMVRCLFPGFLEQSQRKDTRA